MKFLGLILALSLAGCSGTPEMFSAVSEQQTVEPSRGLCGEQISAELGVKLSLIRQQQQQGQYYAALASLDALPAKSPTYQLLRADTLRALGRFDEARTQYQGLTGGCLAGRAWHGLGRIHLHKSELGQALARFQQALTQIPMDADLHNDAGFLLLASGQDNVARTHFLTALELNNQHRQAARNLWFLLLKGGEVSAAQSLQQRFDWSDQEQQRFSIAVAHFKPTTLDVSDE